MMHPVCMTQNGFEVWVDLFDSEAARSISRQPQLLGFVREVLAGKALVTPVVVIEQDMGRPIGYDFIVPTPTGETIFYARLLRDDTYTRFTKNGKPHSTRYVTLTLQRSADSTRYELKEVRIGSQVPPRPGTIHETSASKQYWERHAVVLQGGQPLQPRTVTKICPY